LATATPISYSESSDCLNFPQAQLPPACFSPPGLYVETADVGVNTISGAVRGNAGPSGDNYQDRFIVALPVGLSVTAISITITNYVLPAAQFTNQGAIQISCFVPSQNGCANGLSQFGFLVNTSFQGNGTYQLLAPVAPGSSGAVTNFGQGQEQGLRVLIFSPNGAFVNTDGAMNYSVDVTVGVAFTPEPSTGVMGLLGLAALLIFRLHRYRRTPLLLPF
jgi:hypothetical protein